MKKVIALGLLAAFSTATIASADSVTIIKKRTPVDPDTTGSIVVKEHPDVVKKKIIIKEKHNEPNLTIKGTVRVK